MWTENRMRRGRQRWSRRLGDCQPALHQLRGWSCCNSLWMSYRNSVGILRFKYSRCVSFPKGMREGSWDLGYYVSPMRRSLTVKVKHMSIHTLVDKPNWGNHTTSWATKNKKHHKGYIPLQWPYPLLSVTKQPIPNSPGSPLICPQWSG